MEQAARRSRADKKGQQSPLAALASDPLMVKCYMLIAERPASPNEMAKMFDVEVGHASYRVNKLLELRVAELVAEGKRRGTREHFYRATELPIIEAADWTKMSQADREAVTEEVLRRHIADLVRATEAGTFDSRTDRVLVRHPMDLDEDGWEELYELQCEMFERQLEVQARSDERRAGDSSRESVPVMAVFMAFPRAPLPTA